MPQPRASLRLALQAALLVLGLSQPRATIQAQAQYPLQTATGNRSCRAKVSGSQGAAKHSGVLAFESAEPLLPIHYATEDFLYVTGAEHVGPLACLPSALGEQALVNTVQTLLRAAALDPQLVLLWTVDSLACSDLFYLPIANDVAGIGYGHQRSQELFDDSPDSALEGIAFLNDWPYWDEHPAEFAVAFAHEVAHRWGMRVHALAKDARPGLLLGRQQAHWSYFANTGGSPLEGNLWQTFLDGQTQFYTPFASGAFSDLDLYLMGVLPADQVSPIQLLVPDQPDTFQDCKGAKLTASSPPQFCKPLTLTGQTIAVTLDDIQAVEGPRSPPAQDRELGVSFVPVLLADASGTPLSREMCQAFASAIQTRVTDFAKRTRGRVHLHNLVQGEIPCEEWPTTAFLNAQATQAMHVTAQGGAGCSIGYAAAQPGPVAPSPWVWAHALPLLWVLLRKRPGRPR